MKTIKCPICGKILKVIKEDSLSTENKKAKIHCNKCDTDIEQEV